MHLWDPRIAPTFHPINYGSASEYVKTVEDGMDVLKMSCLDCHPSQGISVSSSLFDFCDFDSLTLSVKYFDPSSHKLNLPSSASLQSFFIIHTHHHLGMCSGRMSITGDPVNPARPQAHIQKSLTSPSKHSHSPQHLCQEEIMSYANSLNLLRNEANHSPLINFRVSTNWPQISIDKSHHASPMMPTPTRSIFSLLLNISAGTDLKAIV